MQNACLGCLACSLFRLQKYRRLLRRNLTPNTKSITPRRSRFLMIFTSKRIRTFLLKATNLQPVEFMTSVPIKELRKSLGMSLTDFAAILGLTGANASDTIRHLENGKQQPSGPLMRVVSYLAQAVDINPKTTLPNSPARLLPKWAFSNSTETNGDPAFAYLSHNRWPRFYATISSDLTKTEMAELELANIQTAPILEGQKCLGHIVIFFIDTPASDTKTIINEAIQRIHEHFKQRHPTSSKNISKAQLLVKSPSPNGLKEWQARLGFSRDLAASMLGMSRSGYGFLLDGKHPIDHRTCLACLAIEAGLVENKQPVLTTTEQKSRIAEKRQKK